MKKIMDALLALQQVQFDAPAGTSVPVEAENLRKRIPAPVLGHFDRLVARGKKGVAVVRGGVCGGCHMRITPGKLIALSTAADLCLCDHCGRYLYLAEGETIHLGEPKLVAARPARRQSRDALAGAL